MDKKIYERLNMKKINLLIGAIASITLMSGITSCGGSGNSSLSDKTK